MSNKLSKEAYVGISGQDYVPYITDKSKKGANIPVIIIGIVLATVFASSTVYSVMKSGLTVASETSGVIIDSMLVGAFTKDRDILGKLI